MKKEHKKEDQKEIVEQVEITDKTEINKLKSEHNDHDLKSDESFKTCVKYGALGVGLIVFAAVFPPIAIYAAIAGVASIAYSGIKYAESKSEHNKFDEIQAKLNYKAPKPVKSEEKEKEKEKKKDEKIEMEQKVEPQQEKSVKKEDKGHVLNPESQKTEKTEKTDMERARERREGFVKKLEEKRTTKKTETSQLK